MDNREITKDLIAGFEPGKLTNLLRLVAPDFRPATTRFDDFIKDGWPFDDARQLGIIELPESQSVLVAAVHVTDELTTRSSKKIQYELGKHILKAGNHNAGIFAFYDGTGRFRLSLITVTYSGTRRQFSTFRRYTFFVDPQLPNKTFVNQIGRADFSSLEKLLEAFSLEAVSDAFYQEFKPKFDVIAATVIVGRDSSRPSRPSRPSIERNEFRPTQLQQDFALLFAIRIIFLGFVQKKADPEEIDEALEAFTHRLAQKEKLDPRHDRIYVIKDFDDPEGFLRDVRSDLALLKEINRRVQELELVSHDPKVERLIEAAGKILPGQEKPEKPHRKFVIFSEYLDTVRHIVPKLQEAFPGRVLVAQSSLSKSFFDDLRANFDAGYPSEKQRDDYDILVATDKLSEGVNLNRAGAVINYDIPWNPTRVIQRLGRINRIGRKVFDELHIYNFFPTEQGSDVVKSREIAAQKMFLIHNTLGEDAKVFAPDETPSAAELFKRINRNPEEEEEESLLTGIRKAFLAIQHQYPDLVRDLDDFPARVKTAKSHDHNELLVFRRKGLQLFIHTVTDTSVEKAGVRALTLEESLPHIRCEANTPRLPLSSRFWPAYEAVKKYREHTPMPMSENSLLVKAENNLRSAMAKHAADLEDYIPFIQTLLRDLKEFQTLPKYTLRRLTAVEMDGKVSQRGIERFKKELEAVRTALGEDYLERIEQRVKEFRSEIIIAVENIKT